MKVSIFLMSFNNLTDVVHKKRREGVLLAGQVGGGQPKIQLYAIIKTLEFETLGTAKQK